MEANIHFLRFRENAVLDISFDNILFSLNSIDWSVYFLFSIYVQTVKTFVGLKDLIVDDFSSGASSRKWETGGGMNLFFNILEV